MAGATAIIGGLSLAYGVYASEESAKEQRKAAKAQKEANKVAAAQGQIEDANKRRANIRQQRIRRAQILQAAENTGTAGGSGAIGATSALATGVASANATIRGQSLTNQNISNLNQKAADAMSQSSIWQAQSNLGFQGANIAFNWEQ